MKEVGLYEAKTQLSALVNLLVNSGEGIALTKHGKVVAELHPPAGKAPKRGCLKTAKFKMAADFDSDALGFEDFFGEPSGVLELAEPKKGCKFGFEGAIFIHRLFFVPIWGLSDST